MVGDFWEVLIECGFLVRLELVGLCMDFVFACHLYSVSFCMFNQSSVNLSSCSVGSVSCVSVGEFCFCFVFVFPFSVWLFAARVANHQFRRPASRALFGFVVLCVFTLLIRRWFWRLSIASLKFAALSEVCDEGKRFSILLLTQLSVCLCVIPVCHCLCVCVWVSVCQVSVF